MAYLTHQVASKKWTVSSFHNFSTIKTSNINRFFLNKVYVLKTLGFTRKILHPNKFLYSAIENVQFILRFLLIFLDLEREVLTISLTDI